MTTTINSFPNVTGQMPTLPNFGNPMFQQNPQFLTPEQQEIKNLREELAQVKARLAEKDASPDIDKALAETDKGCELLRAKYDGVTKIMLEWALANPMLSPKLTAFLDGWKKEAQAYLDKGE